MGEKLSSSAELNARSVMDSYTDSMSPRIPGLVYGAVDKTGETVFSHASGKSGLGQSPMTLDTVFWIASCTKLITSIACMQLVEGGLLRLDDSDQVEQLAPELKVVKVLERSSSGELSLVPKQRSITLRMLLNHTCKRKLTYLIYKIVDYFSFSGFRICF
jgi:CubicO group peptidase (beta-lactamase class C family)